MLGELHGVIERRLHGGPLGSNVGDPADGNARERLGDKEAVPGTKLPGAFRMGVEDDNFPVDEAGQLRGAGFGDLCRAARTVGGDGAEVTVEIRTLQVAEADAAVTRAGAANGDEAETLDSTGDELAVEALADENGDTAVAKVPHTGEQTTVPEGKDPRRRGVVAREWAGIADVPIAKCDAEAADDEARKARDCSKSQALPEGEGLGHVMSLPARLAVFEPAEYLREVRLFAVHQNAYAVDAAGHPEHCIDGD